MRPPLAALRVESQGVPSSWGTLLCLCRVLRPRRDQNHQAIPWSDAAPVYAKDEGCPRVSQSRGSVARPQHSLSTLRPVHHWPRRKTRFRLPARLYRVGSNTHRVPLKGFRDAILYIHPPFPSFPWRNGKLANSIFSMT